MTNNNRKNIDIVAQGKSLPNLKELSFMLLTFALTVIAWVFFRAESVSHALNILSEIFSLSIFSHPNILNNTLELRLFPFILSLFIMLEWIGREQKYAIANLDLRVNKPIRFAFYYSIIFLIFLLKGQSQEFIYFQF